MTEYQQFSHEFQVVLEHGGIVLWIMLGLSAILYGVLASSWFGIFEVEREILKLDEKLQAEQEIEHVIGDIQLFELDKLAWVERRLPVISVMIALAPLAGLLGTVSGMLTTFSGLSGKGSDRPIEGISSGISEALVTTQAGLFMVIPALFCFVYLKSRVSEVHGQLETFVSKRFLESKGGLA